MKGSISENLLEDIRSRTSIVEIVTEYMTLKKSGRNFIGLCPFHKEKTPSFTVNADKQIFRCFGCGEGGDIFSFVMKINNISFPEAVKHLADRIGIVMTYPQPAYGEAGQPDIKKDLYRINSLAVSFFSKNLQSRNGIKAREYLQNRQIKDSLTREFNVGYALEGWRNLKDHLQREDISLKLAEKAGLVIPKNDGDYYDRFRGRMIFPIEDLQGNIIAFGGRIIGEGEPKYLNSPESPIYTKGRNLYALRKARDFIREKDFVLIVEGYFDLLALWNAGFRNTVATLGTALTREHADLIKRYTRRVVILFDPDAAGKTAVERSISLFLEKGIEARVVVLPDGYDPDLFVRKYGGNSLEDMVSRGRSVVDYYIDEIIGGGGTVEKTLESVRNSLSFVTNIENPLEKNLFIKRISERLSIDESLLKEEVSTLKKAHQKNTGNSPESVSKVDVDRVELSLLHVMMEHPSVIPEIMSENVLEFFLDTNLKNLGETLKQTFDQEKKIEIANVLSCLESIPVRQKLLEFAMSEPLSDKAINEKVLKDIVKKIKLRWYQKRHKELKIKLIKAQEDNNLELCDQILLEKERLLHEQKKL